MEDVYVVDSSFTVVSGGQTGADRAGLDWAIANGVRHGGWCPRGRKTEDGTLDDQYRLAETPSAAYLQRTEWNVRDSCATLVVTLTDTLAGGSKRTADFAARLGKPWLHVRPGVHPKYVARFLARHRVAVLNIAGKRESSAPGIGEFTRKLLGDVIAIGSPALS